MTKEQEKENEAQYHRWLLDCVFTHGWTTLKCAREVDADPHTVRKDFEWALSRAKKPPKRELPFGDV